MNALTNILIETEGLSHEQWLEYRRMGIGGSDVSALLGISKWKSELELWLEKTGQSEDVFEENEAMKWGKIMEPVLRNHFAEISHKPVIEVKAILQRPEYQFMLANIDGLTVDDEGNPAILEIKTASEYKRGEWEEDVPAYYKVQVLHYMTVTGIQKAYIAVLIGGNTFRIYQAGPDKGFQDMLIRVEAAFWDKVQNNIRPTLDGSDAAATWLNKQYRGGDKEPLSLDAEGLLLVDQYLAASEDEDEAKARKQTAANKLKEKLGEHNKAIGGEHTVSWTPVTSERLDTKALKAEMPEIVSKYTKSTNSRRFSIR